MELPHQHIGLENLMTDKHKLEGMKMKIKTLISASLFAALSYSSALAAEYPVIVADDRNIAVTFTEKPKSVAALNIVGADIMKAIGEKPIGVSSYGGEMPVYLEYEAKDYVDFGLLHQPNFELLTEQDVDLVIGLTAYNAPFAEEFEKIGKLMTYDIMNIEDSFRATNSVAKIFGQSEKATELNDGFKELLNDYNEKSKPGQSAIFMWVYGDAMYAYYTEGIQGSFLQFLNTKNSMGSNLNALIDKHDIARPIDPEELLELNPDVIFSFRSEGNTYKNNPVFSKINAFKNNRAYHVGLQYTQPHGPIAREMIFKEMAHLLFPETFEKPKIPAGAEAVALKFVD